MNEYINILLLFLFSLFCTRFLLYKFVVFISYICIRLCINVCMYTIFFISRSDDSDVDRTTPVSKLVMFPCLSLKQAEKESGEKKYTR